MELLCFSRPRSGTFSRVFQACTSLATFDKAQCHSRDDPHLPKKIKKYYQANTFQNGELQTRQVSESEVLLAGNRPQQPNDASLANSVPRPDLSQRRSNTYGSTHSSKSNLAAEQTTYLAPARVTAMNRKDSNISEAGSAPDSLLDLYGPNSGHRSGMNSIDMGDRKMASAVIYDEDEDLERSRWIHRDKLARIESQELQAAGIILPRGRAPSKGSKRERSRDHGSGGISRSEESDQPQGRPRLSSLLAEEEAAEKGEASRNWDLRLPEEAAAELTETSSHSSGQKGSSRIPVLKTSPLPIPQDFIERDTPMPRRQSNGGITADETIFYPKSRSRSQSLKLLDAAAAVATPTPTARTVSEGATKKLNSPAPRKGSATNGRAASSQTRPQTRSGSRTISGQRSTTKSGETKRPEGDPPWLATMYKPDPRLPPDQQLLPTVAKRLQQEQWEREGKFGNAYDRDFRPLNDQAIQPPAEVVSHTVDAPEPKVENEEWPLQSPKSPTLSTGRPTTAGAYSTMPKIQSPQQTPITSPRPIQQPIRVQEPPEEDPTKKGCCCVVM